LQNGTTGSTNATTGLNGTTGQANGNTNGNTSDPRALNIAWSFLLFGAFYFSLLTLLLGSFYAFLSWNLTTRKRMQASNRFRLALCFALQAAAGVQLFAAIVLHLLMVFGRFSLIWHCGTIFVFLVMLVESLDILLPEHARGFLFKVQNGTQY
jgi:hypothetical protein